jgi:hypothetical protein
MAEPTKKTAAAAAATAKPDDIDSFVFEQSTDGVVVSGAGGTYTPGKSVANGKPVELRGWGLRTEARTSQKYGEHVALVFAITRPTVVVDADGNRTLVKDGLVSVVMTKALAELEEKFNSEDKIYEYSIIPTGEAKSKLANGHDMWFFTIKIHGIMSRAEYDNMTAQKISDALALNGGAKPAAALQA